MKFTRSWLENYINVPFNTDELCHHLTMAGLEVDDISSVGKDHVIDIDLTPNRSDCLSVLGVARELNSINKNYKYSSDEKNKNINSTCGNLKFKFSIDEKNICPRYGFMYLRNISPLCDTPKYISQRLSDIGINLVHPIVDILNYIMIDIGQPMHAYDADKINGEISVRLAKKNEIIKALDGNEYKLCSENIVVADSSEIISLAGIIGSNDCSVTKSTKNIVVESAFFKPNYMANKARKLKLQTESSHRFERGVDYNLPKKALMKLQNIILDNKVCDFSDYTLIDNENFLPEKKEVKIDFGKIRKVIGIDISDQDIEESLVAIGCDYSKKKSIVSNPSYRYDLNIHADYIEEIARLYGYDNIPVVSEKISIEPSKTYAPFKAINKIKQYLYDISYSECINYSFVNDDSLENFTWDNKEFTNHYKISNYMSLEQNKLRSNLTASLIKNIEFNNNANSEKSYRFYEISNVFDGKLDQVLTCVVSGDKQDENWASKKQKFDKYDLTTVVEDIGKIFGIAKSELKYVIKEIKCNKKQYIALTLSIKDLINKIQNIKTEKFINYSKLPYIRRDLSFLIGVSVRYESILKLIEEINVHSLKKILLFDLYVGKNIPSGFKSMGMGFIFQDETKTLTHDEADKCIEKILKELKSKFKIELRK
tara:strand:+ start:1400 stop:3361 length:1962 start_codon:yes stop_codon:yes gene_type:complete